MCAGTVVGYVFVPTLGAALGATGWAWCQALVAGTILHVVFGRPHIDPDAGDRASPQLEGVGNLCALLGPTARAAVDDEANAAAEWFGRGLQYAYERKSVGEGKDGEGRVNSGGGGSMIREYTEGL